MFGIRTWDRRRKRNHGAMAAARTLKMFQRRRQCAPILFLELLGNSRLPFRQNRQFWRRVFNDSVISFLCI